MSFRAVGVGVWGAVWRDSLFIVGQKNDIVERIEVQKVSACIIIR